MVDENKNKNDGISNYWVVTTYHDNWYKRFLSAYIIVTRVLWYDNIN